ncbi:MAG: M28 family peptidase [Chitinophagaceae bacterium]|nr:M28 family peptidase [Chitinophagaceae bacterium]MCW5925939.1 M28 family peptidase [Chitinophagaceae bacterium]
MKKLLILVCVGFSVHTQAQQMNPKPFAKEITAQGLKEKLYIIAGEEMEGRGTATDGERKAAAYIEEQFKQAGLFPGFNGSYQMPFPVYEDSLVKLSLAVNGKEFTPGKDFSGNIMALHNASYKFSELVFAGFGISNNTRDDYKDIEVKGKLVLVLSAGFAKGIPEEEKNRINVFAQQEAAEKKGAAALLIVNNKISEVPPKGNLYVNLYKQSYRINTFTISEEIARAIAGGQLTGAPRVVKTKLDIDFVKQPLTLKSYNVLGLMEGSDLKDEYVVLTAHYDHMGSKDGKIWYGADDDGSGTVTVMELAKAFAKAKAAGKGPRRSILFMTVSGEEKGLWGSAYYGDHPAYPLEKTTVNLNIDMIGRIDPGRQKKDSLNYIYIVGDDKLSSDLKPISEAINKKYMKLGLDYKFNDPKDPMRIYYRSDHYNFAKKGVPIIFYFSGLHPDYHQPTDTPDKINYPLMQKRAQLVFYTAWEMANRDAMLKRDIPLN